MNFTLPESLFVCLVFVTCFMVAIVIIEKIGLVILWLAEKLRVIGG